MNILKLTSQFKDIFRPRVLFMLAEEPVADEGEAVGIVE